MHRDNWYHRKQASVSSKIPDSDKQLFNDICKVFQPLIDLEHEINRDIDRLIHHAFLWAEAVALH